MSEFQGSWGKARPTIRGSPASAFKRPRLRRMLPSKSARLFLMKASLVAEAAASDKSADAKDRRGSESYGGVFPRMIGPRCAILV